MSTDDKTAVQQVIDAYVDAMFHGNIEELRRCFHPDARMNGFLGEQKLLGTPEPFFDDIGSKPSMASNDIPYKGEIVSLELAGHVASVTLQEKGIQGGISFINYFHLLKENSTWKIISKTFTTL